MTIKDYEKMYKICEEHYTKTTFDHARRVEYYAINDCRYYFYEKEDKWFIRALALAHDLIEDTDVDHMFLLDSGFSEEFVQEVDILTHNKNDTYEDYIVNIASYGGRPLIVKCADMKDHLKQKHTLTPRLKEKYSRVLKYLK